MKPSFHGGKHGGLAKFHPHDDDDDGGKKKHRGMGPGMGKGMFGKGMFGKGFGGGFGHHKHDDDKPPAHDYMAALGDAYLPALGDVTDVPVYVAPAKSAGMSTAAQVLIGLGLVAGLYFVLETTRR